MMQDDELQAALAQARAEGEKIGYAKAMGKQFPVMLAPDSIPGALQRVPWWWLEQFSGRIEDNHDQTLAELARRGGLDSVEIWAAYHNKRLKEAPANVAIADAWLIEIIRTIR